MPTPNVLPDWWSFLFIGYEAAVLIPMAFKHVTDPIGTFMTVLPKGYDKATDNVTSSRRIDINRVMGAQTFILIAWSFIGCTLFARNSLHGQPILQQRLMKLPLYAGLFSDLWLYATIAIKVPREVLYDRSKWTSSISGIIFGLPVGATLKLIWLFGIGRDVV